MRFEGNLLYVRDIEASIRFYQISLGPVEEHGSLRLYVYDPSGYNLVFGQPVDR